MLPVLFTGAPGAGKTTLLHALATQGHRVVAESAREVIRSRLEQGLSPRPTPVEFAREVLHRDVLKYEEAVRECGYVFFDRGVPDALGMLEEVAPLSSDELATYTSRYSYGRCAFLFPAWEAIFENDAERDQSFEDALRVQAGLTAWYGRCGYEPIEMPLLPIEGRCLFVLDTIASMAAE
jgi:predicted ATPase